MNYKEFEKKVRSMTSHDIIMSMVDGLRKPRTEINMMSYGYMRDGVCFGCAATNAILRIMDVFDKEEVEDHILGRKYDASRPLTLAPFEKAINYLRLGNVSEYNYYAMAFDFARIKPMPGLDLPYLHNDYTEAELQEYVKLAKYQLTTKTN